MLGKLLETFKFDVTTYRQITIRGYSSYNTEWYSVGSVRDPFRLIYDTYQECAKKGMNPDAR